MRIHAVVFLVYGLLLVAIAAITAVWTGLAHAADRWVVIATGFGGFLALVDFFATRVLRRIVPTFGVRTGRIVMIFYLGLLGWLLWRASSDGLGTAGGGEPVYATVVLSVVLVLTLAVTVCEFLLDRTGREFQSQPDLSAGEPHDRKAVGERKS